MRYSSSYPHSLLIILCIILIGGISCIHPTQPILANPNTESSPSNFMFHFMLNRPLPSSGYLLITFTPYNETILPASCSAIGNETNEIDVTTCVNLRSAGSRFRASLSDFLNANPSGRL
jgi:hypothetical protein